jgi:hypothetical protein
LCDQVGSRNWFFFFLLVSVFVSFFGVGGMVCFQALNFCVMHGQILVGKACKALERVGWTPLLLLMTMHTHSLLFFVELLRLWIKLLISKIGLLHIE